MRCYRELRWRLLIAIAGILSTSLVGQVGCTTTEMARTKDFTFALLPQATEVTLEQLSSEYLADEAAADAKYQGKRLLFSQVLVDNVVPTTSYQGFGIAIIYSDGFMSRNVKFTSEDKSTLSVLQSVRSGYVLNITGECLGLRDVLKKTVTINISWMQSVKGELATLSLPPAY